MEHSFALQYAVQLLRTIVEIGILAVLIYSILFFVRGTRAAPVLAGITVLALILSLAARALDLPVLEWLLSRMWGIFAIAIIVIFQPEIRRALAEIGSRRSLLFMGNRRRRETVELLADAVFQMASRNIGALIAVERRIGMRAIAESGTAVDARISRELLLTIFYPKTALHDGGVIIRNDRIAAAGCIFPLSESVEMSRLLGTRHRAGVGVTEETDAVAIIVSEETGAVSLAYRGRLVQNVDRPRLLRHLENWLIKKVPKSFAERISAFPKTLEPGRRVFQKSSPANGDSDS